MVVVVASGVVAFSPAQAAPPTPVAGKAAIYGAVAPDAGPVTNGSLSVSLLTPEGWVVKSGTVSANGSYFLTANADPGTYRLQFDYSGSGSWVRTYWAPPGGSEGDTFILTANQTLEASGPIHLGSSITGTVTVPDTLSPAGIAVEVRDAADDTVRRDTTDALGAYELTNLAPGNYYIYVEPTDGILRREYWPNARSIAEATPVIVDLYNTAYSGIDVQLDPAPVITGVVTRLLDDGSSEPVPNVEVQIFRPLDSATFRTGTDSKGRYVVHSGGMGDFVLRFQPPDGSGLAPEYWEDSPARAGAIVLSDDHQFHSGYDVVLSEATTISGRVRYETASGAEANLAQAWVQIYWVDERGEPRYHDSAFSGTDGAFVLPALPPGDYLVRFSDGSKKGVAPTFWGSRTLAGATKITATPGSSFDLGDIVLRPPVITTDRISGSNRFATAVEISKEQFPAPDPDVPVVYIANGLNYPDALTAGPAAIHRGGGLLLVTPDSIPAVVAAELERLDPEKIVIVGSASSISDVVRSALAAYVDSPSQIQRLGGANRYITSELVVRDAFGEGGADTAFIATGLNYPDALAAGPAAGYLDAPIILVNGAASAPDAGTLDLISYLGVDKSYFVGSSASLSDGIVNRIVQGMAFIGQRFAGANRYETAAQVNSSIFGPTDDALIATGTGYADALAGGPLAGARGIPLYLSKPTCVPGDVFTAMSDLGVSHADLLGGVPTLSADVAQMVRC